MSLVTPNYVQGKYTVEERDALFDQIAETMALYGKIGGLYDVVNTGPATGTLEFNNLPNEPFTLSIDLLPRQTGSGTPAPYNIRPFIDRQEIALTVNGVEQTISIKRTSGTVPFIAASRVVARVGTIIVGVCPYYATYNGQPLRGRWACDRAVYSPGTLPPDGSQVVDLAPIDGQQAFDTFYSVAAHTAFVSTPQETGTNTTTIQSDGDTISVSSRSDINTAFSTFKMMQSAIDYTDAQTNANFAQSFSALSPCAVGEYFIHDGLLYRCTTPHTGAWDASHFASVSVGGDIASYLPTLFAPALPIITKHPDDVYVGSGEPSSMSVEVAGPGPFTYQWQIWDAPAGAWANSSATGNKTDTVTVTANTGAFNGGRRFRCAVSNANGTVYSRPALVNPDAPIALAYSAQSTYAVDDFCINNGILQRCTTPIITPEPWTAAHWAVEHVDGAFVSKALLKSIAAAATSFSDFKSRIAAM